MISIPDTGPELGRCNCGRLVRWDSFRDRGSVDEWYVSSCCQVCQDKTFLFVNQDGDLQRSRVCFGAIAAHQMFNGCVEITLLPFLFARRLPHVVWEARNAVRIGFLSPWPPGHDLRMDFVPMVRVLHSHHLRLTQIKSPDDPRLDRWFSDLDLLVALDTPSLCAIARTCPSLARGVHLPLADVVPWSDVVRRPLLPFHSFVRARELDPVHVDLLPDSSPLRICALMGAALHLEDGAPLRHLIQCLPASF